MSTRGLILTMILFLIIGLFLGYSLGNHSIVSSSSTYYESIGKVPIPDIEVKEPEITVPSNPVLPKIVYKDDPRLDSIIKENEALNDEYYRLIGVVDSLKVYNEYITKNSTKDQVMYDNEYGKFSISYDVQFNKLQRFYDPKLEPIREVKTIIKEKKYTPFIDLGISTSSTLSFGGGLIDNSSSLGIRYNYQITKNGSEHFIGAIKTF